MTPRPWDTWNQPPVHRLMTVGLALLAAVAAMLGTARPALAASSWLQVSAGGAFTCGIKADHTLWCWGRNAEGQLGTGDRVGQLVPHQVGTAADWRQVSAGQVHACATTEGNALYCWGDGVQGQLGLGADIRSSLTPSRVSSAGNRWVSVDTGFLHTCGLRTNSAVYCWGDNEDGQVGDPAAGQQVFTPVAASGFQWKSVTTGGFHTCGISATNRVYCWGYNGQGQLGLGDTEERDVPTRQSNSTSWTSLDAGYRHTCGLRSNGTAWCWGDNSDGTLGTGDNTGHEQPTAVVSGAYAAISAGTSTTCALETAGVWCWGSDDYAELGPFKKAQGVTDHRVPNRLTLQLSWSMVSAGGFHICAIADGTLWCWGRGFDGELGTGATLPTGTPRQVTG